MVDYMVMEAVALKVQKEDEQKAKDAKRRHEVEEARKSLVKEFGN